MTAVTPLDVIAGSFAGLIAVAALLLVLCLIAARAAHQVGLDASMWRSSAHGWRDLYYQAEALCRAAIADCEATAHARDKALEAAEQWRAQALAEVTDPRERTS